MKALITLCFASLAATVSLAQSQPTMQSQARYSIDGNGKRKLEDSVIHKHSDGKVSYGLPIVKNSYCPYDGVYTAYNSITVYKSGSPASDDLVDGITRAFNSAGQLTEYREQRKPASIYKEVYKEWYNYNADLQIDTQWATNYQEYRRLVYVYQNNICIAKLYEYVNASKAWELYGIDSFIANGTDSIYARYEGTPPTQMYEMHHYLRDAGLRVIDDSSFTSQFSSPYSITHTTYDAAGQKLSDSIFTGPTKLFNYAFTYLYDNNRNLVSRTRNSVRDTMTYNGANQLTSVETYERVNNAWRPQQGSFWRYYYYGFPAGVADVANGDNFRLYPIPATTYINLDISFDKPENFSVRIMNINGQLLRSWSEQAQPTYKKHIQLDGLPAGNYIVQVVSENNNITRQFSVLQ